MSDKKVLTINPELFSFSNNKKTKKSKPTEPNRENIRVKNRVNRKQDTLRKQSLLKMIRKQQEDRYKRLISNNDNPHPVSSRPPNNNATNIDKFNTDFDDAREFLDKLTKKTEMNVPKNTTLRKYPDSMPSHSIDGTSSTTSLSNNTTNVPQYGCLKNGSLPTYRNYMNKTQTNRSNIQIGNNTPLVSNIPNIHVPSINSAENILPSSTNIENKSSMPNSIIDNKLNESMKRMNELKQQAILNKIKKGGKPKKLKRKKTLRRTYKIGRSSIAPKVSVLVSNKTLRNRVTTKSQLLKQTPIQEVKKYLIKQGIIRVGSTTPTDVLRKMYETLSLVCGEIQNHNPDTLLYNYINDTD